MAIEPTKKIYEIPLIKKNENTRIVRRKREKNKEKGNKKGSNKVDIKV